MVVNRSVIRGVGAYLPKKVLTNADLATMVDTTDDMLLIRDETFGPIIPVMKFIRVMAIP